MAEATREVSEKESLSVAEASRQKEWAQPSFLRELFLGDFRLDLLHPYPLPDDDRPEFAAFYAKLKDLLERTDSAAIDETGEYPPALLSELRTLGAFGMKIPKEYGGLGFTNVEYQRVMQLLGSCDGNIVALLSAHQSIGVPQPLKLFGTDDQKKKYLPRCAKGEISAFALTEHNVGSDPARLATTAVKTADGSAYILNGRKLWCTNGTLASLLVVMAVDPETKKISAYVVETAWAGVKVEHRSHFMGLRALANAVMSFTNVRVPVENLIGAEGKGLKIALTTLNDGRLSIPSGSVGTAKVCLEICRTWAAERVQWGKPVGKHEAIAHKIADMAAHTFAMEAVANLAAEMSTRGGYDIRLEAAAAKEWNSARCWEIVDDTMQIRGGRGYETEQSLRARGEAPIPVERMMRDYRINKIFEGSSEIMHLFMAREMVDRHLQAAGPMADPDSTAADKLAAIPKLAGFYGWWYPTRWLGFSGWPRYSEFGELAPHLRFVSRTSRKLARQSFHGMLRYQAGLQNKQAFLFRLVDVANDLFAMAASVSRAHALAQAGRKEAKEAGLLADMFCRIARRRIAATLGNLWGNDDVLRYRTGVDVLGGRHAWLEEGTLGVPGVPEEASREEPVRADEEDTVKVAAVREGVA